jgi:hypothetical protein
MVEFEMIVTASNLTRSVLGPPRRVAAQPAWTWRGKLGRILLQPTPSIADRSYTRLADGHIVRRGIVVQLLVPLLHESAHAVVGALDVQDLVADALRCVERSREGGYHQRRLSQSHNSLTPAPKAAPR